MIAFIYRGSNFPQNNLIVLISYILDGSAMLSLMPFLKVEEAFSKVFCAVVLSFLHFALLNEGVF